MVTFASVLTMVSDFLDHHGVGFVPVMVGTLVCVILDINSAQLYICERIWLLEEMFPLP